MNIDGVEHFYEEDEHAIDHNSNIKSLKDETST